MWFKFWIIAILPCALSFPKKIPIGGLFGSDVSMQRAFELSAEAANKDASIFLDAKKKILTPKTERVTADVFQATKKACKLLELGVAAIFGPQEKSNGEHIRSICETMDVPCIMTEWDWERPRGLVINFFPDAEVLSMMVYEIITEFGWTNIAVLYENTDSLIRLHRLFKNHNATHYYITATALGDGPSYRENILKIKEMEQKHIIIDCSVEILPNVLAQIQEVGMMLQGYSYFIHCLDLHTLDIERFQYAGVNLTGIRMVVPDDPIVQEIYASHADNWDLPEPGNLLLQTALMYDAVQVFAKGFARLENSIKGNLQRLPCNGSMAWGHGISLSNFIRSEETRGLTGQVRFDAEGFRSDFQVDIFKLTSTGPKSIGLWNTSVGTRWYPISEELDDDKEKSLKDKHFIVLIALTNPYGMWKESATTRHGNDRFEGFAIDLIAALSKSLGFNYTFEVQTDNAYGTLKNGRWNGMIKKIIDGHAHLAITDLSITAERESAVDFTVPFMNLGISILFKKPTKAPPSMLSFLAPFKNDVWISMALAWAITSVLIFIISRICPAEWCSPYPCIEEPEVLENQFSLKNALWFTMGSIMQQGTELAPIGIATRGISTAWWFFCLTIMAIYTANLAAFLTAKSNVVRFENVEQLARQDVIKYGAKSGGSTLDFFKGSSHETYQRMYKYMSEHASEVLTDSNETGLKKVQTEDYAYFMESTAIEYFTQRNCDVTQVNGLLDAKTYGIAMQKNAPYRKDFNTALLRMKESGIVKEMELTWWRQKRGGGKCADVAQSQIEPLTYEDVGGIFVVTMGGIGLSAVLTIIEFLWYIHRASIEENTPFLEELRNEITFLITGSDTKAARRRKRSLATSGGDTKSSES